MKNNPHLLPGDDRIGGFSDPLLPEFDDDEDDDDEDDYEPDDFNERYYGV